MARRSTPAKGAKLKCDLLFSQLVRERDGWRCRRCGKPGEGVYMQCAHIVSRRYSRTRCDFSNAVALCPACHMSQTDNVWDMAELVGADEVARLRALATDPTWKRSRFWWDEELERLRQLQREAA
jgi:hypothetical protein